MQGPWDGLRREIESWSSDLREASDEDAESGLDDLLQRVLEGLDEDINENGLNNEGEELTAAVHQWASLASHAVANVYAPASPFPRDVAGFGQKAIKKLQKISSKLGTPLDVARTRLGADSYSVSVGFPWGISVGFSWS